MKKPTGLNALLVPLKSKIRLSNARSIKIKNENEDIEIFIEIDDSFDITILKVDGTASKSIKKEEKKKVIEL